MSRAFVKESDGGAGPELPELQISPFRNLVTQTGLRQIEATVERLRTALTEARASEDPATMVRIQRDLRYWTVRWRTAEVVVIQTTADTVRFGTTVALQTQGRARFEFQIVGEDEADPANGKISYVSPIAKLLIGRAAGEMIDLPDGVATIVTIH